MAENPNYIRSAAYHIANATPLVTPGKALPGSFDEETSSLAARKVPSVPPPATTKPTDDQFFVYDRHGAVMPNAEFLRVHFLREGRLTEQQAIFILERATQLLSREPNMLAVQSPVTGELITASECPIDLTPSSLRGHSWPICERCQVQLDGV